MRRSRKSPAHFLLRWPPYRWQSARVAADIAILEEAYRLQAEGRDADALATVERGVADGNPFAFFVLGDWRLRGVLGPRDTAQARTYFSQASDAGMPTAHNFYTNLLAAGIGGEPRWSQAISRLRMEAAHDPRRQAVLRLVEAMDVDDLGRPGHLPAEEALCESPEVRFFPRLFSPAECAYLIAAAQDEFRPSTVTPRLGSPEYFDAARNSEGSTLHWLIADPAVHALNMRIAAASGTAIECGEPLHILRYAIGQEFRTHMDSSAGIANQRIKTALVYLNDDYEGGETSFPKANLIVRGHTGDALIFRNASDEGIPDEMSSHAGLPVTAGVKLLASRWIRKHRYEGD
jgi:prolyl 4-hydroxylase